MSLLKSLGNLGKAVSSKVCNKIDSLTERIESNGTIVSNAVTTPIQQAVTTEPKQDLFTEAMESLISDVEEPSQEEVAEIISNQSDNFEKEQTKTETVESKSFWKVISINRFNNGSVKTTLSQNGVTKIINEYVAECQTTVFM